jgi:hypothetical protein
LNRLPSAPVVAALLATLAAGSAWLAQDAAANFGETVGFSGRGGATCVACHTQAPVGHAPATAVLEGLPEAWEPGVTYRLTVRVEGGPAALPPPAPQGGFDLSIAGGRFSVPPGFEGKLHVPHPQEATYTAEGTLMREWQADWTAPGLEARPAGLGVWLAVVSANGNHVVAAGASDGGERFDAAASLTATLPPAPSALAAWKALPLRPPTALASGDGAAVAVAGEHPDGNATALAWSLDGAPWQSRPTGSGWRLRFEGLAPGSHVLLLRSEGSDRRSPEVELGFEVPGFALPALDGRASPAPPAPLVLAAAVALASLTRRIRP